MYFSGPFVAANISSMITASKIVDTRYNLKLEDKYLLAQAPITTKSPIILQAYEAYIAAVVKQKPCPYKPSITLPKKGITQKDLLLVEDEVKKISLYLWLSYKLPEIFPDHDKAYILRNTFNAFIENSLKGKIIQIDDPRRGNFKRKDNHERPRRDSERPRRNNEKHRDNDKESSKEFQKDLRPRRARGEFKPRRRKRD